MAYVAWLSACASASKAARHTTHRAVCASTGAETTVGWVGRLACATCVWVATGCQARVRTLKKGSHPTCWCNAARALYCVGVWHACHALRDARLLLLPGKLEDDPPPVPGGTHTPVGVAHKPVAPSQRAVHPPVNLCGVVDNMRSVVSSLRGTTPPACVQGGVGQACGQARAHITNHTQVPHPESVHVPTHVPL